MDIEGGIIELNWNRSQGELFNLQLVRADVLTGDGVFGYIEESNGSARGGVVANCEGNGRHYKVPALLPGHPKFKVGITVSTHVGGPAAGDGDVFADNSASNGHSVDLRPLVRIPARADHAGLQEVLVLVRQLLNVLRRRVHRRRLLHLRLVVRDVISHYLHDLLRVCGYSRLEAGDAFGDGLDFVADSVGDDGALRS